MAQFNFYGRTVEWDENQKMGIYISSNIQIPIGAFPNFVSLDPRKLESLAARTPREEFVEALDEYVGMISEQTQGSFGRIPLVTVPGFEEHRQGIQNSEAYHKRVLEVLAETEA